MQSPYSALEALAFRASNLRKQASDGLHSSAPDDPSGDGTVTPSTGDLFSEMDKEIEDYPFSDVTAMDDGAAYDNNVKSNLGNVGTDVAEMDDYVVDEYNTDVPDPGTESQVKTSGYKYASLSFGQTQRTFNQLAEVLLNDLAQRSGGYNVKTAAWNSADIDAYDKARIIADTAEYDAELFAKHAMYVNQKNASGAEVDAADVPDENILEASGLEDPTAEIPPEVLAELDALSDEELDAVAEVAAAVDSGEIAPEELEAAIELAEAVEAGDIAPEELEALASEESPETEVKAAYLQYKNAAYRNLMYKVANNIPVTVDEVAEATDAAPEDVAALAELPPEELEALAALGTAVDSGEITPEEAEALLAGAEDVSPEEISPEEEVKAAYWNYKQAAYDAVRYKFANGLPVSVDEAADAAGVAPEELEALAELPPEDLDALAVLGEAIESGEIAPEELEALDEEIAAEEAVDAGEVSEDEAVSELSSAMAEQGVTPEDLESVAADTTAEKAASLRQIARGVRGYRMKYASFTRSKTARSAAIRQRCKTVLNELMN